MLHVVGVVINESYLIEGLVIEGKPSEFGEISDKPLIRKNISRSSLIANKFNNSEVSCNNGKVTRKEGFKFSDCELYGIKNNKIFRIKDNSITILRRFVEKNETAGFEVKLLGKTSKLTTSNVIALSNIFKPVGYTVAYRTSIEKRLHPVTKEIVDIEIKKPYLTGINGTKLSDLPIVKIDKLPKGNAKAVEAKPAKADKPVKVSTKTIQNIDIKEIEPDASKFGIIDLIMITKALNGLIVTNSESSYTRQTVDKEDKEKSNFVPLEMVQVAEPVASCSEKNVNVNLKFKKLGFVYVDGTPIPTFMWREKCIFSNGKPNLSKFSIAVSTFAAKKLLDVFGSSLAIEVNDKDKKILASIKALGLRDDVECLLNIDASKLSIVSNNASGIDIYDNTQFEITLFGMYTSKLLGKICNEIKKQFSEADKDKDIFSAYKSYNSEMIDKIKEAGVNITDGSYNAPLFESVEGASSSGNKVENIEIEYFLDGYRTVPKVSDLLVKKDALKLAKEKAVNDFENNLSLIADDMRNEDSIFLSGLNEKTVNLIQNAGLAYFVGSFYLDKERMTKDDKARLLKDANNALKSAKDAFEKTKFTLGNLKLNILSANRFESYGSGSLWEAKKARANQKADIYVLKSNRVINLSLRNISFTN